MKLVLPLITVSTAGVFYYLCDGFLNKSKILQRPSRRTGFENESGECLAVGSLLNWGLHRFVFAGIELSLITQLMYYPIKGTF
jgi:hypothetical protein